MKHKFIAKQYWKDITTPMGIVDKLAKEYDKIIDLSLGDPDLITHDIIIDNAFEDAKKGHTKYTDFRGDPELRNEIIKFYMEEHGVELEDSEIMVVASGCLGMYLALEAILDSGDEVIIHAPHFTPYPQQIELAGGKPVVLDTFEEEGFEININRLENLINERTKAVIINTPNNPTGNCLSYDNLKRVAEIAKKHDILIISDEIYGSYSYQEPFESMISIEGMKERSIIINSFSKDFTMTGWRVGNNIAPDYIIKVMQQINENVVFTAPSISQRGAIHALRNRHEIQKPMIVEYRSRVCYAVERIGSIPRMSVSDPKGTFYLFVNIKKTGLSSVEASDRILREARVLSIPGVAFGNCGEGYVRIACTVEIPRLKEAFNRIAKMDIFK